MAKAENTKEESQKQAEKSSGTVGASAHDTYE
jgi:hypothetical protein